MLLQKYTKLTKMIQIYCCKNIQKNKDDTDMLLQVAGFGFWIIEASPDCCSCCRSHRRLARVWWVVVIPIIVTFLVTINVTIHVTHVTFIGESMVSCCSRNCHHYCRNPCHSCHFPWRGNGQLFFHYLVYFSSSWNHVTLFLAAFSYHRFTYPLKSRHFRCILQRSQAGFSKRHKVFLTFFMH